MPTPAAPPPDARDRYLASVVRGKSFVDVGGLWGTLKEKVSVAHAAGAASVAMLDITPPEDELWPKFHDRRRELGVPDVQCISADVVELAASEDRPRFDVVHCSGILYHLPDPFRLLTALHAIAREHVVIGTAITQRRIENEAGVVELPASGALFVPALGEQERRVLRAHWDPVTKGRAVGISTDVERWDPADFDPWWWLPTVETLRAMCKAAGLEPVEGEPAWGGNSYQLLLRRAVVAE